MADLHQRFKAADQIPAADLVEAVRERLTNIQGGLPWALPSARPEEPRRPGREIARRMLTIAAALAISAVALGFVFRALGQVGTSPAGPPIAFDQVRGWIAYGGDQIVAVDPTDPTRRIALTEPGQWLEAPLAWASDGSRLLFSRRPSDGDAPADLFVLDRDGTEVRVATDAEPFGGASFSPRGTQVVYVGVDKSIFVVDAAGGEARLLVAGDPTDKWYPRPAWSPDGTTIAYATYEDRTVLWLMDADGTSARPIFDVAEALPGWGGGAEGLAWSPDGLHLAFAEGAGANHSEIFVVNADGTDPVRLTRSGSYTWNAYPSWSPDGERVAFLRLQEGHIRVSTVKLDGSGLQELLAFDDDPVFVAWNPVTPTGASS